MTFKNSCIADEYPLMNFNELVQAVKGIIVCNFSKIDFVSSVAIDSRNVKSNSLFIPLRGEKQDGHLYIEDALKNGAVCFFADVSFINNGENKDFIKFLCEKYLACCVLVENNLTSLQLASKSYLQKFPNLYKIGITGSSGKTTTKEILASIYSKKYNTIINEGNLNSETGLPLSVFRVREDYKVGIFELGMNREGEIKELADVLFPNAAIITNIGTAHIGILGSKLKIAKEKKQIFSNFNSNCIGLIPDCEFSNFLQTDVLGSISVYLKNKNIKKVEQDGFNGSKIFYKDVIIKFPLVGIHNVENAIACISFAEKKGFSVSEIKLGLEAVRPLFGRSQVKHGFVTYLLDCYNANPDSMEQAINFCDSVAIEGKKHFVIASMLELGTQTIEEHKKIIKLVLNSSCDFAYFFGDDFYNNKIDENNFAKKILWFKTSEFALLNKSLRDNLNEKDFVLLKGSRGLELERLETVLKNREAINV